ncbi:hypothetical protein UFOVP1244_60 [uncultured Caudovirales phage]|uniref:Uncharacterized protein n=1 Tax=uncultured Caudovirales phage TaxID=2100421 RepID=A0A6J5RA88_9CAUD|nr:hypothetical protein UFOVP1244_60 [uncultured Caudovirales phage]
MSRIYWEAHDFTRTTTTNTTFTAVKVSLAFLPNASKNYVIFWSCLLDIVTSTVGAKARLQNTTAGTTTEATILTGWNSTTLNMQGGGMAIYTSPGSPVSQTFEIQYATTNAGTAAGISEASIFIMELSASDVFAQSLGQTISTSSTYATKVTLTFTPATAGDYFIIGHFTKTQGDDNSGGKAKLYDQVPNTYEISELGFWLAQDINSYMNVARAVNISAAQTWKIDFARSSGTANAVIADATILALRMDGFANKYWAEDRSAETSTSTTYVADAAAVTATPAAETHLLFATGYNSMSSSGISTTAGNKVQAAGADVGTRFSTLAGATGFWNNWTSIRMRVETASSTTWQIMYNRVTGAETASFNNNVIAVMQITSTSATVPTGENAAFTMGITPVVSPAGI